MKFSIVTPTSNAERYLRQTIASVVGQQGSFDIEYIVVDNMSTDGTCGIFEDSLSRLDEINAARQVGQVSLSMIRMQDGGMYEAINRGFASATGDLFAWINADDLYLPGAFERISRVFAAMPQVKWLKGVTSYLDDEGCSLAPGRCYLYAQDLIRRGLYGREAYFIQQDSVFWRADLWRAAGGLNENFRLAGDYDLWIRFAELEALYVLNFPVSCFRKVSGQLSEDLTAYRNEQKLVKRPCSVRDLLLRRFFASLEPRCPDWLNALAFRALCPFAPLYVIEGEGADVRMKKTFKYKV